MTHILAVANQKGGVGKTTTAINLAAGLAGMSKSTLLIDLDPQGNATVGMGIELTETDPNSWHLFTKALPLQEILKSTNEGVMVLPSNMDLTAIEVSLVNEQDRNTLLRDVLRETKEFEYILIDCPPSLSVLTVNALVAATGVLIPMQCEYFALEGLASLLRTIDAVKQLNRSLDIDGLLRTMYDSRTNLMTTVSRQLFDHFPDKVYRTVIPRNVRLAEAPSHGISSLRYDARATGSLAYRALTVEVTKRHQTLPRRIPT